MLVSSPNKRVLDLQGLRLKLQELLPYTLTTLNYHKTKNSKLPQTPKFPNYPNQTLNKTLRAPGLQQLLALGSNLIFEL